MKRAEDSGRLAALFPEGVIAEEGEPRLELSRLYPEEAAQIARAVDKRKAEYATARVLARRAFVRLGVPEAPVVNAEDRCPTWPDAVVGSITHTTGYCGVVVAKKGVVRSLGVDVERDDPARVELWDRICTEAELAWVRSHPEAQRGMLVKHCFSAKEAFYKAQYPLTRQYLGFHDVELVTPPTDGQFTARLLRDAGELETGRTFEGALDVGDGLVRSALFFSA